MMRVEGESETSADAPSPVARNPFDASAVARDVIVHLFAKQAVGVGNLTVEFVAQFIR